jgi:hypothetical protein
MMENLWKRPEPYARFLDESKLEKISEAFLI